MSALLTHFSEDCFNKCSNLSDKCFKCESFSKGCNGLLRNYLREECKSFQDSITMAKDGQYQLTTNIKKFHTLAIDHLIGAGGNQYSVIHWIGHDKVNEETYDDLDFHFLNALLTRLTNNSKKEKSYSEKVHFKIRWLLIGDEKVIMDTYDYIFYVVDQLKLDDKAEILFDFHVMSESDYSSKMAAELVQLSSPVQTLLKIKPNIGIFGEYFMFTECENGDERGTIYMKNHNADAGQICHVTEALKFYNTVLSRSGKAIPYSTMKQKYDTLMMQDVRRNETLASRWKSKSRN
jgi:hypothetical protein